jgi:nitric oxide reductase activation protein
MIIGEKVYKYMQEDIKPEKLGSIGISSGYEENRDGTSFKSIARRHFKNTQNNALIMIVISDGKPYHGGTSYIKNIGIRLTENAVKSLQQMNINMFALSIDPEGNNYLGSIYGKEKYIVLIDLSQLNKKVINLVTNIVKAMK